MTPLDDAPPAPVGSPAPVPAATIDASGLTCGGLEPLIAQHLRGVAPGEIVEVRSDRSEAGDGIQAWVRLAGHALVAVEKDHASHDTRYFIRRKTPQT
jgi:TusA-related sulfurtransferase